MWKCEGANVFGSGAGGTPASGNEADAFLARRASASRARPPCPACARPGWHRALFSPHLPGPVPGCVSVAGAPHTRALYVSARCWAPETPGYEIYGGLLSFYIICPMHRRLEQALGPSR